MNFAIPFELEMELAIWFLRIEMVEILEEEHLWQEV
jgi:hypothetical protein